MECPNCSYNMPLQRIMDQANHDDMIICDKCKQVWSGSVMMSIRFDKDKEFAQYNQTILESLAVEFSYMNHATPLKTGPFSQDSQGPGQTTAGFGQKIGLGKRLPWGLSWLRKLAGRVRPLW